MRINPQSPLAPLSSTVRLQKEISMALNITNLKPYVPAKDFELSKRFYSALGFTMCEAWGGT